MKSRSAPAPSIHPTVWHLLSGILCLPLCSNPQPHAHLLLDCSKYLASESFFPPCHLRNSTPLSIKAPGNESATTCQIFFAFFYVDSCLNMFVIPHSFAISPPNPPWYLHPLCQCPLWCLRASICPTSTARTMLGGSLSQCSSTLSSTAPNGPDSRGSKMSRPIWFHIAVSPLPNWPTFHSEFLPTFVETN